VFGCQESARKYKKSCGDGMNQIDCYQNIITKLIVTPKWYFWQ